MARYAGFIGPSYTPQSVVVDDERTVNWIPSRIESAAGAARYVFDPSPGFSLLINSGVLSGFGRASFALNEVAYAVIGVNLISIAIAPFPAISILVNIGGGGAASIAANGFGGHQLMAANGIADLYYYDTNSFASAKIATVQGHVVGFLDGYFIALNAITATIYVSALFDGTSWDPADAAQRSDQADKWKWMLIRSPEIWLFGSNTTSVYYNQDNGANAFPFVPNPSVAIEFGIHATQTACVLQGNPIWLADDLTVRMAQGYNPVRVSTHATEYAWSQYHDTTSADAYVHSEQGHAYYTINFASGSWRYDLMTGLWHEVGQYNAGTGAFDVLPAIYATTIGNPGGAIIDKTIVLSRSDQKIYYMSQDYATEVDGTTLITRRRRAPNLVEDLKFVRYANFELFAEVGVITPTPTVTLQYSDNGGQTFNAGKTVSAGALGNYSYRIRWAGSLGQARNRVFQVTTASPLRLVDAFVDMSVGAS